MRAELVGIGLGIEPHKAWYIPFNGKIGKEDVLSILKPFLENPNIGFYGHNLKYDFHVLLNEGITLAIFAFDTILASYLLNSHSRQHSPGLFVPGIFRKSENLHSRLIGKGKNQISMREVPLDKSAPIAAKMSIILSALKNFSPLSLKKEGLTDLFYDIELPLLPCSGKDGAAWNFRRYRYLEGIIGRDCQGNRNPCRDDLPNGRRTFQFEFAQTAQPNPL